MGIFSDDLLEEVRLEHMRPEQIGAAQQRQPAVYVPFGAVEWHGYHNVVGLDALKAHEQLVGLAVRVGGVVYPPVYFGAGSGHGAWPASYMVAREPMIQLVADLLHGFERDGFRQCILLSGHYPNRSEYLDATVTRYGNAGGRMRVLALVENEVPGVGGDHAATYETSSMLYLHPLTVDLKRLQHEPQDDIGGAQERKNWMGEEYRGHPCYGLVGTDPRRNANVELGRVTTDRLIHFLAAWVGGADASGPVATGV